MTQVWLVVTHICGYGKCPYYNNVFGRELTESGCIMTITPFVCACTSNSGNTGKGGNHGNSSNGGINGGCSNPWNTEQIAASPNERQGKQFFNWF